VPGFLRKFFPKRSPELPDNTRLLTLLSNYWKKEGGGNSYEKVALELLHGNCFLLLPTPELVETGIIGWHVTTSGQKISLASVYTWTTNRCLPHSPTNRPSWIGQKSHAPTFH
jgi:hypothetical protein